MFFWSRVAAALYLPPFLRGYLQYNMSNDKPEISKQPQAPKNLHQSESSSNSPSKSRSQSNSSSNSSSAHSHSKEEGEGDKKQVRYKYCCKICKHPDKSKRACVCVVPLSQRRASLGTGCRNCGCIGCSKEDFISKGQDPEYRPSELNQNNRAKRVQRVQRVQRVERVERVERREEKRPERRRDKSNSAKRNRSPRRKNSRNSSSRSRSPQYIDSASMKFYNVDRSLIGGMIANEYQLSPSMLGFGVPQRTYSYVFGKPK